jgi:hypothetical protein
LSTSCSIEERDLLTDYFSEECDYFKDCSVGECVLRTGCSVKQCDLLAQFSDYESLRPGCGQHLLDYDSSEEELNIINMNHKQFQAKRKWSQMTRYNSCDDSAESSDDEEQDLGLQSKPLQFGSCPPKSAQRLGHILSPARFWENILSRNMRLCSVSPRKRCRQMDSTDVSNAAAVQRPYLDFEKMQVCEQFHIEIIDIVSHGSTLKLKCNAWYHQGMSPKFSFTKTVT